MNLYKIFYTLGKLDKETKRNCLPPPAIPNGDAFTGYVAGYNGHAYKEPVSTELIIEKLKKQGMRFYDKDDIKF